ncbi:MAG TPA: PLDc N-terminal domain-containing protein [Micromonosporaceae bacterium]|nr:PLDc N-terminal domain-containing protein [Micromonosporaceae bacterium]
MLFIDGGLGLVLLGLWVFCLIDVITTDADRVRNLPKIVWLLIVLLLPDIGSVVWLVAGHPWEQRATAPRTGVGREFPEYDRPGRHVAANPEDDEAFLRQLRARAEEQRRKAAEERRAREAREARDQQGSD